MSDVTAPESPRRRREAVDAGRFARDGGRNRFTARAATVLHVGRVAPQIVRVTVSGPEFADFTSGGPADHVRVFFPDAATGELVAPAPVGPGEDGIVRPDRASIARDFTPLPRVAPGGVELDLDFFVHPDPGPASSWAESAQPGDQLVIVGPRGSKRAPQDIDGLLLICDETSLPSVSRWIRDVPSGTRVDVIAAVSGSGEWIADYLGEVAGADVHIHVVEPDATGATTLAAMEQLPPIGEGVFVWAAGEASALVGVRRHLRRTLGLSPSQAQLSGYWRRGTVAFDHHAPIDPFDPDE
ncbi:NADPH-dependent ferric siderophore reductase, contains FAD-binding and SIP domains [Microbacterium sp. cf046]|uniref:siderophore-interacting protein n=1 Tax=Microbacterium sp. cf046 TaxID=1761803 RepID=UPI0008E9E7B3|nr:siderophore-interacting protein [Microbacterium sp. cf046]SFR89395.1 NADPH-dependent ferric siderophore reductase, contains FAD-binding and SIP domains [Microbacterium sp. cf046]